MNASRRTLVTAIVGIALLAVASRDESVIHALRGLLGPQVSLSLPTGGTFVEGAAASGGDHGAPAAQLPPPAPIGASARAVMSVSVEPSQRAEQGYLVEAQLTSRDGKPLNQTAVRFYDRVELLGPREMLIGSGRTDGSGRATVKYLPAEAGRHEIVVRTTAADPASVFEGRASFEADIVAPAAQVAEQLPLSPLTDRLPWAGGAVLLAVWALFLVALGGAIRGVLAGVPVATERKHRRIS